MEPTKPDVDVIPMEGESIGPADSRVVGPYIPMDRHALLYLDHVLASDPGAAREFVGELIGKLERAGAIEV